MTHSPIGSSPTALIQDLGWPTIRELIHRETSVTTYKCLKNLALDYLRSFISKLSDRHTRELRYTATDLLIPRMKASYGQKYFAFRRAKEWNNLDLRTKLAPSCNYIYICRLWLFTRPIVNQATELLTCINKFQMILKKVKKGELTSLLGSLINSVIRNQAAMWLLLVHNIAVVVQGRVAWHSWMVIDSIPQNEVLTFNECRE